MKKLLLLSLMIIGSFCYGQSNKPDTSIIINYRKDKKDKQKPLTSDTSLNIIINSRKDTLRKPK